MRRTGEKTSDDQLPSGAIKIGRVARHFAVSVELLRLYERAGLLIPLRSSRGTRYFTERDFEWIANLRRLVCEARLGLAAIRARLALLPCWEMRDCGFDRSNCPLTQQQSAPCWVNRTCCRAVSSKDCYFCCVYRSAPLRPELRAA